MKKLILGGLILAALGGVAYLATLGCCQMLGMSPRTKTMTQSLNLDSAQKEKIAALEKEYLARKQAGCEALCAKRAQLIQVLKQERPDSATLDSLVQEISREQTALEKTTLEHLLAVSRHLDRNQRERLIASVTEELRSACKATACGSAGACHVQKTLKN